MFADQIALTNLRLLMCWG